MISRVFRSPNYEWLFKSIIIRLPQIYHFTETPRKLFLRLQVNLVSADLHWAQLSVCPSWADLLMNLPGSQRPSDLSCAGSQTKRDTLLQRWESCQRAIEVDEVDFRSQVRIGTLSLSSIYDCSIQVSWPSPKLKFRFVQWLLVSETKKLHEKKHVYLLG